MALRIDTNLIGIAGGNLYIAPAADNSANPPPSGADAQAFATNAKAQPETISSDPNVYTDDDLVAERNAVKALVPRGDARWVAVDPNTDRNWSDASAWWDTQLNVASAPSGTGEKVLIPQGVKIIYDVPDGSEENLAWVRIDGELFWSTTVSTKYTVDFTFVDHTGHRAIGTAANPVPENVTHIIEPYRTDDMDFASDPMKLGRGFLCFDGKDEIFGASVLEYARATTSLLSGQNTVGLQQAVESAPGYVRDWKIGDELVVTGTRLRAWPDAASAWRDHDAEVVTITGIQNGDTANPLITFSPALVNDHLADHLDANKTAYVVHRTRNIKFRAPNGEATEAWRRPHNLWKGNQLIDLRYFEVRHYGRTDHRDQVLKDESVYALIDNEQYSGSGAYTAWNGPTFMATHGMGAVTARTNFQGRYSVHFHRMGFENPNSPAGILIGAVVVDNNAWGTVIHDSHVQATRCIAHDCMSGGIITEGGGSFGFADGCVAGISKESHKNYPTVQAKKGGGEFGDRGHAYWFNSRTFKVRNCIAHDSNGGFTFTSRSSSAQSTNVYPGATDEPLAFYGQAEITGSTVDKAFAPIQEFLNCEAFACVVGGSVAKKQSTQHHNVRSVLRGLVAWEVQAGFHVQYTGNYTIKDFDVTRLDIARQGSGATQIANKSKGIDIAANSMDVVVVEPTIRDCDVGIRMAQIAAYSLELNKSHRIVAPTFSNVDKPYALSSSEEEITVFPYSNTIPGSDDWDVLTLAEVGPDVPVTYDWLTTVDEHYWDGSNYIVFGSYTDRLGTLSRILGRPTPSKAGGKTVIDEQSDITGNTGKATTNLGFNIMIYGPQMEQMIRNNGYYTKANGEIVVLFPDLITDRFSGEITYFDHPVAIRCSQRQWDAIGNKTNNGALPDGVGEAWEGFAPAGTPGLT